jgi:hypothetical protein
MQHWCAFSTTPVDQYLTAFIGKARPLILLNSGPLAYEENILKSNSKYAQSKNRLWGVCGENRSCREQRGYYIRNGG